MTLDEALHALRCRGLRPRTVERYAAYVRRWQRAGVAVEVWLRTLTNRSVPVALAALRAVNEVAPDLVPRVDAGTAREVGRRATLARLCRDVSVVDPPTFRAALARCRALPGPRRRVAETALRLGYFAGLRGGDVRTLLWGDLDLNSGAVVLPNPKGGRPCRLPLAPVLLRYLRGVRGAAGDDEAVCSWRGMPLSIRTFWRQFHRLGVTPHGLRRGFATGLLRRGVPIATVSRLLNHANLSTTMIYYCPDDDTLGAAVAALEDGA